MELSALAAKQQRVKTWLHFIENEVQSAHLKARMSEALDQYRAVIARCWKAEKIAPADEEELRDLERQLESLDDLGRLTVIGRHPSNPIPARF